jgi:hypothetical protein
MYKIFKYPLEITDTQFINAIPCGYKILKVAYQGDQLCIWIMVNTEADMFRTDIRIDIYGTGQCIDREDMTYLDTVHAPDGLVWHVFKVY